MPVLSSDPRPAMPVGQKPQTGLSSTDLHFPSGHFQVFNRSIQTSIFSRSQRGSFVNSADRVACHLERCQWANDLRVYWGRHSRDVVRTGRRIRTLLAGTQLYDSRPHALEQQPRAPD